MMSNMPLLMSHCYALSQVLMINFQTAHWCRIAQMTSTRQGLLCDLDQPDNASMLSFRDCGIWYKDQPLASDGNSWEVGRLQHEASPCVLCMLCFLQTCCMYELGGQWMVFSCKFHAYSVLAVTAFD